jgi:hypothetical protein
MGTGMRMLYMLRSLWMGSSSRLRHLAVTDEKLLAKLRSIKGQYIYRYQHWGVPVFYYEYCEIDPRMRIVPDQR